MPNFTTDVRYESTVHMDAPLAALLALVSGQRPDLQGLQDPTLPHLGGQQSKLGRTGAAEELGRMGLQKSTTGEGHHAELVPGDRALLSKV